MPRFHPDRWVSGTLAGCRTPELQALSLVAGDDNIPPFLVLRVVGAKLGTGQSPSLLSNWLFLCGWLEIFFVTSRLRNLSWHHGCECLSAPSFRSGELFSVIFGCLFLNYHYLSANLFLLLGL